MTDRVEKTIELNAPVERVWRALTDHHEFGQWFGVQLDQPFAVGQPSTGRIPFGGGEPLDWRVEVIAIEPPSRFAFTWHPYAIDRDADYAAEPPTLVEFRLTALDTGTRLTVAESGFDRLPPERRDLALRMNTSGWATQMDRIGAHVGG